MAGSRLIAHFGLRRRRLKVLLSILLALAVVHGVLTVAVAEFPMLVRGGWLWLLSGAPGAFDRKPQRVFKRHGRRYLWAGKNESDHFDITQFRLESDQLHWALGREYFPALIEPEFVAASEADDWLADSHRVLLVAVGDETKVYPLHLLRRHEVVYDTVGGRPIFAAYCVLADLAAIYDRRLGDHAYTFAVSGYTYDDENVWDGRQAFILWDRDTESLWWPPIGKAVSGPMMDTPMKLLEPHLWAQTTWGRIKTTIPDALVLKPHQDQDRPPQTHRTPPGEPPARGAQAHAAPAIPPRWGENDRLGDE